MVRVAILLVSFGAIASACAADDDSGGGAAGSGGASGGGQGGNAGSARAGTAGKAPNGGSSPTAGSAGKSGTARGGSAGSGGRAQGGESGESGAGGEQSPDSGRGGGAGDGGSAADAGAGAANGGDAGTGTGGTGGTGGTSGAGGEAPGGEAGLAGSGGTTPICTGGQTVAGGEACNRQDDDCDGEIDEELGRFECGIGACRTTVAACVNGEVGACVPAAPVASSDGCNGVDDDCDGAVDEDCADCVRVAPNGDDAAAPSGVVPFATLQAAIDFAASGPTAPPRVCVAAGADCGDSASYKGPPSGDLTMRDGIDVFGNYRSQDWSRCADSLTRIVPRSAAGVLFPDTLVTPTILDGFAIERFAAATTSGVTVHGADSVLLSHLTIVGGPDASHSYGVNVSAGATATIFQSEIDGGAGSISSIGVRAVGARVFVEDNCPAIDAQTGRCTAPYYNAGLAIRGRTVSGPGLSIAVLLDAAPGSRIERSRIAVGGREILGVVEQIYGVLVTGDAEGTLIRANSIGAGEHYEDFPNGFGAAPAALQLEHCGGAKPWIVDNESILFEGWNGDAYALRSLGDCHPVIDSNRAIVADGTDYGTLVTLACQESETVPSRCVISNNAAIHGAGVVGLGISEPLFTTAVECLGGSCAKISGNQLWGARPHYVRKDMYTGRPRASSSMNSGITPRGLVIQGGGAFVDGNAIRAGCSGGHGIGVDATGPARISNNQIFGVTDACHAFRIVKSYGLIGRRDVDVHSNLIDGGVLNGRHIDGYDDCRINGLTFGDGGVYRNNLIRTSTCREDCYLFPDNFVTGCSYAASTTLATTTTLFENNSLEGGNALMMSGSAVLDAAQSVNLLPGYAGNVEACGPYTLTPSFSLSPGSTCIHAGTNAGAPALDYEGDVRGTPPDIGPDEVP